MANMCDSLLLKNPLHKFLVADVSLDEFKVGGTVFGEVVGDVGAFEGGGVVVIELVDYDDGVTAGEEVV